MVTHEQAVEHTRTLPQLFPIHIDIGTKGLIIHGEIALDSHQLVKGHIQLLLYKGNDPKDNPSNDVAA